MKRTFFIVFFLSLFCVILSENTERKKIFYLEKKLEQQNALLKQTKDSLLILKDTILYCEDRRIFLDKIKKSLEKVKRNNYKKYLKAQKDCEDINNEKKKNVELYNKVLKLYVEHKKEKKSEEDIYKLSILVDKTLANLKYIEEEQKDLLNEKELYRKDYIKMVYDLNDIENEQKFLARSAEKNFSRLLKVKKVYEDYEKEVKALEAEKSNLEDLQAALEKSTAPQERDYKFDIKPIWPVEGKIFKNYGENVLQEDELAVKNQGLDFIISNKDIKSIYIGKVIRASWFTNSRKIIAIDHLNGYISIYIHKGKTLVTVNDKVKIGQKIAVVGEIENREINFIHFELRKKRKSR